MKNNGYISAADVTAAGLQRRELTHAAATGELEKMGRGLYCLPGTWKDECVIAQHRFARGVFSHETALYLLELSDQAPETLTMTFPRGYNTTPARKSGLITRSAPDGEFDLGLTAVNTLYGNEVIAYDAERTLCDMLRGTADPDTQLFLPAIKIYLSSASRSIPKLQSYSDRLGVSSKMRGYLEVLL